MEKIMTKISARIGGREEIHFEYDLHLGELRQVRLTGVGGPQFLRLLSEWRTQLKGKLAEVPIPQGSDVGTMLMREVILKAQGGWNYPYQEKELCHCRAVPTEIVDCAILTGAHDSETVSRLTSASTACGTCRPDVEALIAYRLGENKENDSSRN